MPRPQNQINELNRKADSLEPLFAVSFVRAMKKVQDMTSINSLAMQMGNARQAQTAIPIHLLKDQLQPLVTQVRSAVKTGGKLGQKHLNKL